MKKNSDEVKLTKKDLNKAYLRWQFFCLSAQNFERMMALAFTHTVGPILEKLYKDDPEEIKNGLKRHMQFFNTEPQLGTIIPGIVIALEEARAKGQEITEELIVSTKNALMGPFAGLGDSIIVGTYIPILLSIALGMSKGGSPMGAIFYALVYLGTMIPLRYLLFMKGYELGLSAAENFLAKGLTSKVSQALNTIGLIVIGGVSAQFIKAPVALIYKTGEMEVSIQAILDSIMPKMLPLTIVLSVWYLIDKRKWTVGKVFLGLFVLAAVFVFLGIF